MMTAKEAKRQIAIENWIEIIKDQKQSGLRISEYCRQHGLSRNTFFYWQRIIRERLLTTTEQPQETGSPRMVELIPGQQHNVAVAVIPVREIAEPVRCSSLTLMINDISIIIDENTSASLLKRTIEVVSHVK